MRFRPRGNVRTTTSRECSFVEVASGSLGIRGDAAQMRLSCRLQAAAPNCHRITRHQPRSGTIFGAIAAILVRPADPVSACDASKDAIRHRVPIAAVGVVRACGGDGRGWTLARQPCTTRRAENLAIERATFSNAVFVRTAIRKAGSRSAVRTAGSAFTLGAAQVGAAWIMEVTSRRGSRARMRPGGTRCACTRTTGGASSGVLGVHTVPAARATDCQQQSRE